jgi:carnitine O-acetyltransferase
MYAGPCADRPAQDREHLLSISPKNVDAVRSLEDSLFCLSLDSDVLPVPTSSPQSLSSATPSSVHVHARNVSGAGRGGHNRWFDKALTVVMEPNGRGGINGEHSPCDALIPSIVIDFALAEPAPEPDEPFPGHISGNGDAATPWRKLEWHADEQIEASITRAQQAAKELCDNSDMGMLWFDEYGAEWIKKVGKQSPDAYLQMALQLAFATATGKQTATYETASTRSFKHGRTDVIRSFSNEAYDFVQAVREKKPAEEVYRKLSAATKAHNDATRASSTGRGFDRHLTGLRLVYDAAVDGAPEEAARNGAQLLLGDELLAESQTWLLSTSGLSAGDRFS